MSSNTYCIVTDLEGVTEVDSFSETATRDEQRKDEAMTQLAAETNACIEGITDVEPEAYVHVTDMHGPGGIRPEEIRRAACEDFPVTENPFKTYNYEAVLFVGMHAMAGTAFAPLAHTIAGDVEYYRLNGTYIGEFAGLSFMAGLEETPAIFLSSDDKAVFEARQFVPRIETVVVKFGHGIENADHRDPGVVCDEIREQTATAVQRRDQIQPLTGFEAPYTVEIRYQDEARGNLDRWQRPDVDFKRVDERTVRLHSDTFDHIYP